MQGINKFVKSGRQIRKQENDRTSATIPKKNRN